MPVLRFYHCYPTLHSGYLVVSSYPQMPICFTLHLLIFGMENSSNSNSKSSKYLFTKITPNSSQRIPITFSVSHVVKPHVYDKITEHGGFVIQGNNANYNIVDADKSSNTSAIDYHWILACVQQGTLVSTDKYRVKQGAVSRIHRYLDILFLF